MALKNLQEGTCTVLGFPFQVVLLRLLGGISFSLGERQSRCHFCKKLGHIKVDCHSFAAWKKKKDVEGAESKKEESTGGKVCDCVLGSLGMTMLGFKLLTPQGDVDLLSYNRSSGRVHELQ